MDPGHARMAEENTKNYFRFNGTNYNDWKYRIDIILEEKELMEYVQEDLDEILFEAPMDESRKHIKKEKKCKSLLVKHIADDQLEYVKDKTNAKDMYEALRAVFERESIAGQLLLRKKLITMKYDDNGDMTGHILKFDKIVRKLKAVGAKMEKLDLICHLLLTLPKSYEGLVTALETMHPELLNMEFVKSRLLDENNKRFGGNGNHTKFGESVAMITSNEYRCHNCGRIGHKRSECRSKSNGERSEYQRSGERSESQRSGERSESQRPGERSEYRRSECHYGSNSTRSECCNEYNWMSSAKDDRTAL